MSSYPASPPANGIQFIKNRHTDTYPFITSSTQSNHSGRNVLVTGASKGVGRATALAFAQAGASGIAIAARSSLSSLEDEILAAAKEAGKPTPKVLKLEMDVSDYSSVEKAAKETEKEFGFLDVLINNAAF